MIDVSIIFVNYNTAKLLTDCLESVKEKTKDINYEIIIVDNASNAENKELLERLVDDYKVVFSDENLGFGRANNLGVTYAKGKYLFLLNTDTLLINNAVKELYDHMEATPDCGVVGGNLYDGKGNPCHSYLLFMPSIKMIVKNEILPWKFSYPAHNPNYYFNASDGAIEVGYVTGADLMIRKDVFDKVNGFDSEFFMYCEESELCNRVRKSGYKIMSCPSSRITHFEGSSTNLDKTIFNEIQYAMKNGRSQFLYYKKVYGHKFVSKYYWTKKFAILARFYRNKDYKKQLNVLKKEYIKWKNNEKYNK